jgi:hypothetical protein
MLKLTSKGAVRFSYADDAMEALFTLNPSDSEEELVSKLQRMLEFVQARQTPLPERIPGMALGMAQTAHPAPEPAVGNGWANLTQPAPPELPADRQGDWEMIPPGEQ